MKLTKKDIAESLKTYLAGLSTPLPGSPSAEYEIMKEKWNDRCKTNSRTRS